MKKINRIEGNFALFTINDTKIMLPQSDVGRAEYFSSDIQWSADKTNKVFFVSENVKDAVFVFLSQDLHLETEVPEHRFIGLSLKEKQKEQDQQLIWVWSSAQILMNKQFQLIPLPDFVCKKQSPILGYVIYNNHIVYYCDTKELISHSLGDILS